MGKGWMTVLGFVLVLIGISSVCLEIVGVQFAFLTWLNGLGRLFAFLIKILMIIAGFVIVFLDRTGFFIKNN